MRILVTAFDSFGGDTENASQRVAAALAERWSEPAVELAVEVLPVSFRHAPRALQAAIEAERPDAVVCLGEAGLRAAVTPELRAGRLAVARIPDNEGYQPLHEVLDRESMWLDSRVDLESLADAMRHSGAPIEISDDAGTFVCNATYRHVLREFDGLAVFVHVPALRSHGRAGVGAETDRPAANDVGPRTTQADRAPTLDLVRASVRLGVLEVARQARARAK